MAHRCGRVFSHSKGSWVAGLQQREAHTLVRREVRWAVAPLVRAQQRPLGRRPLTGQLPPTSALLPSQAAILLGGAQGHACLFFPWADMPASLP